MLRFLMMSAIKAYRRFVSPWTPPSCRFTPTCSAYGLEALERHGALKGGWLTLRRVARCHPWGGEGYDPVPGAPAAASVAAAPEPLATTEDALDA